jgi:hypothetical protein
MGEGKAHCLDTALQLVVGPHRVQVDSGIMVDAAFFQEMNLNYSRLKMIQPARSSRVHLKNAMICLMVPSSPYRHLMTRLQGPAWILQP